MIITAALTCNNPVNLTTGLTGTVIRGPVTPVCQVDVSCDAPFSATFDVQQNGRRVATFTSDAEGRFTVRLAPGNYVVVPTANAPLMNPSAQTKSIVVGEAGLTSVQLSFDTGIR